MDKNLLKEFIIEEYEKDFVVYATDEAYRLLGVEVPQPVSPVTEYTVDGTHYVVIPVPRDTIDAEYYREAVLTYLQADIALTAFSENQSEIAMMPIGSTKYIFLILVTARRSCHPTS